METVPEGMSIPPELEFKPSGMEADQIGVWSKKPVKQDEKYGPFLGIKRKLGEVNDDTYSWEIRGPKGRRLFCIDASDPSKGNWMRFVKSARYYEEQNMIAQQENKNIFYKTLRDIPAGEELLCWYNSGEPPSEEMHNETMRKEAKAKAKAQKSSKDTPDKTDTSGSKTSSKQGTKASGKDVANNKTKSKDKAKVKSEKSGKQSKQSDANNKTVSKSTPKSKQTSTDTATDEKKTKEQSKTSADTVGPDEEVDNVQMNEMVKISLPTTLSISEQTGRGSPVVKLTPMDTDSDGKKLLVVETKLDVDKDLLTANCGLKSPDMPILENMTKEGFLIPSPSKHATSWSSNNMATTKVVGGVICHEIAPPKISPVLPITKNQGTPVQETLLPPSDGKIDLKKVSIDLEEKLAIQAPDVSSTEESSGPEREVQDEQDKDSHVTSSRSYAQETESVTKNVDQVAKKDVVDKVDDTSPEEDMPPDGKSKDVNLKCTTESKSEIVEKKVKKAKKGKPKYKCHVCGSVFGKPVHVKIHISKKHGLQARKSASKMKIFVPGKREKIRTRSVTKSVSKPVYSLKKVTDRLHNQKLLEKEQKTMEIKSAEPIHLSTEPIDDKAMNASKAEESYKENLEEEMDMNEDPFDEPPPEDDTTLNETQFTGSLLSGSASMIPMMYSSSSYGHREGKNCGTYRCEFCHRVFRYKTWLAKHLEMKHPGKTPTISYEEIKVNKEKSSSPVPPPPTPTLVEDKFVEEELTPEQIQILKDNSKGKRLKIFPCSICGRRFSSKTNVRRHKRLIHKILVRPRRTRLPYPEYTVEEEEKPTKSTVSAVPKVRKILPRTAPETKVLSQPVLETKVLPRPVPETIVHSELPSTSPSPVLTGMRKPRKNKSPLKRSHALHRHNSQEDFAQSFLTFPIESNPNPLSAFMPTKPETFELESAVYNKRNEVHPPASSIKRISEPSMPSPTSSPPHEGSQSRRTGPPPAAAAAPSNVGILKHPPQIPETSAQKTSRNLSNVQTVLVPPSSSRRKPSSVTHLHPKVPSSVASHQQQTNKPAGDSPYMPNVSSLSRISSQLESKLNSREETFKHIPNIQSGLHKPSFTNPWVSTLKPQPFVPKKPKTEFGSNDEKKEVKLDSFHKERPITQSFSASQADLKKLDTFSVLNLKRREPTPPPKLPVSDNGVLDLTVRKKPRIDTPEPTPPKDSMPSEPLDENQPLDLSSSNSKSSMKYKDHPTTSYANKMKSEFSSYAKVPKYEFHHMSPASFGGKEPEANHGPYKKHVQTTKQTFHHHNNLLMKVDKDKPKKAKMQHPQQAMQPQHSMQAPKSSSFRPLLPKPTSATHSVLSPPQSAISQMSPPRNTQQMSPHLVAAQVVKQANAQSALRPILPKPVGAATPVFIGGKVVAAGSPPPSNKSELKKQSSPDGTPLDSTGFACNVCNVPFSSIKALVKHVVIHAQEWPYKCEFCVRLYQDTEELIQHRTQHHHVGKTFSCGVCKRDFAYKSNLKKHQADVHNLTEMNFRELGPKELRAHNFTDPAKIKTGPPELPPKPERVSFLEQEMKKQTPLKIGKLKIPVKTSAATPTKSTQSPRKAGPINPQRHHPFAHARQIGYLNMLNDPRNQEVLQSVNTHRCTKCSKEFAETAEFHGHIMECALQGMDKVGDGNKEKDKNMDAEKVTAGLENQAVEASEKKMKMKAYTKSKKKAIQQRQSGVGKRQRAKPGLKTYNPQKYPRRRSSASVDDVHACPGCDKKFYFINKLERHMRICPNRDRFKGKKAVADSDSPVDNAVKKGHCCPFCTRQFTYLKSLKKHALVCPARNPNITDPIRLIEDNFKQAQRQMEAIRPEPGGKPTKTETEKGETSKQAKTLKTTAKKRRKRKRTDVIPRPKKRKRTTASTDLPEDESKTTSSPRIGAKRNPMLIKIGQKAPPKKQETADGETEGIAARRQLLLEKDQSKPAKIDALQDKSNDEVAEKIQFEKGAGVSQTFNSVTENIKVNAESLSTTQLTGKDNNNEAVTENNVKCDNTTSTTHIKDKQDTTCETLKNSMSKNHNDHPSTAIPSSAGNLPDQSAKKHVAEAHSETNQTPDKNQCPNATEIHSMKQSSTRTISTSQNGNELVINGSNDDHGDMETKMNGNDRTALKEYPVRNRLQSAS